ncbi:hypothetical protein [Arthrobacter sp.]|uniref:hypothetical protein n=1 Tax=Arthrobacter sp. TaxID=1667 RepID=UPI003A94A1B9
MTLQTAYERPHTSAELPITPSEPRRGHTGPRRPRTGGVWKPLGLTMLIPFFLATVMGLAYLGAFHQPAPHHLPVAVVGSSPQTLVFAQTLKNESGEELDVRTVPDAATARQLITDRQIYAAYAPGQDAATLLVSSAASETTANIAQKVFLPIAYQQHLPLKIDDVVPAGEHDSTGQGLFFLLVALSIGGYASAIPISGHMGRFRLAGRFGLAAGAGAVVAGLGLIIAGPIYHIIDASIWGSWLISWLYVSAIVLLGMGLHPMLRHWTTPVLTLLFVALNFTSSGGIFVPEVQPGLFAGLSTFWNGNAWLHAVQTIAYFPGQAIGLDLLMLALWLVPGALLLVLTHIWSVRKTRLADENASVGELDEAGAA